MQKIRWGILSTAHIGRSKVIPALQTSTHNEVSAICSRDLATARTTAKAFDIERAYGSYEELIADPNIDAIYNPLPNHLHVDWTIKAMEAGKHVLCEKPIGLDTNDTQRLLNAVSSHPKCKVMEAFMYRFHPQWNEIKNLLQDDGIGKLRTLHSHFSYNNRDSNNIRNMKLMGGGALLDIGCYTISVSRLLFDAEPKRVVARITPIEGQEVDCIGSAILEFEQGTASFTISTKTEPHQFLDAGGEKGSFYLTMPFTPAADATPEIHVKRNGKKEVLSVAAANQYTLMADSFALSIIHDQPVPTPLSDAMANMKVIDALFASAATGTWAHV